MQERHIPRRMPRSLCSPQPPSNPLHKPTTKLGCAYHHPHNIRCSLLSLGGFKDPGCEQDQSLLWSDTSPSLHQGPHQEMDARPCRPTTPMSTTPPKVQLEQPTPADCLLRTRHSDDITNSVCHGGLWERVWELPLDEVSCGPSYVVCLESRFAVHELMCTIFFTL